jgi:hypothetical protein
MILKVKLDIDNNLITKLIRTEDISEVTEDAYDSSKTKLYFYDSRDTLTINENIKSFSKRFIQMELDYFYEEGSEFEGDEEIIKEINKE